MQKAWNVNHDKSQHATLANGKSLWGKEDGERKRIKSRHMDLNLPLRPRSCPRCRTTATGIRKRRKGSGAQEQNPSDTARVQARGRKEK